MNIFLIGFMGSGKTTVGKILANRLHLPFVDLDLEIEKKEGISASKYFASSGEQTFRETERNILLGIITNKNQIISTGGGAPCYSNNMEIMNREGVTVYLKMNREAILKRLLMLKPSSLSRRLLIAEKSKAEMMHFIETSMDERENFYNRAGLTVSNESDDACIAVERIISMLHYYDNEF
jgi:shikimate kinase